MPLKSIDIFSLLNNMQRLFRHCWMLFQPRYLRLLLVVFLSVSTLESAIADVYQLKTGGQISGVLTDRGDQGEFIVQTDEGAIISVSRRQISKQVAQNNADKLYTEKSRTLPDTVEAHHELATWCTQNKLGKQAELHLERILQLDPNDEAARLRLGYQQLRGRWLTRDEIMAARGLVKYGGKYRTTQDIALREQAKQSEQIKTDWFRQLRTWVGWLDSRRSVEAAQLITNVKDPAAAEALVKLLEKGKNPQIKNLLLGTLAELKHPLAVTTLVDLSIFESEREVRLQSLDYLLRYHQPINIKPYINALNERKYDNVTINRAAEALHRIEDTSAISPLIDALVTTHKFKISDAPPGNTSATFTPSGGGGFSAGNKPKFYTKPVQNIRVRQALVALSRGQDYEFDEKLWRVWFVNEQIEQYVDTRRDQ